MTAPVVPARPRIPSDCSGAAVHVPGLGLTSDGSSCSQLGCQSLRWTGTPRCTGDMNLLKFAGCRPASSRWPATATPAAGPPRAAGRLGALPAAPAPASASTSRSRSLPAAATLRGSAAGCVRPATCMLSARHCMLCAALPAGQPLCTHASHVLVRGHATPAWCWRWQRPCCVEPGFTDETFGAAVLLPGASEVLTWKVHWQALRGAAPGQACLRACRPHQEDTEVSSGRASEISRHLG
jgi:hypothetical protein